MLSFSDPVIFVEKHVKIFQIRVSALTTLRKVTERNYGVDPGFSSQFFFTSQTARS